MPDGDLGGRERLLQAAVTLFAAKGYAATTVRDILRAAGVTAPVLYYHFGNKEGLFLSLVREGSDKLDHAQGAALARAGTVADRVRGYCRAMAQVRREYANLVLIVDSILAGPPAAAPAFDFRGRFADAVQRLESLVGEGISSGELRACDPHHAALALLGAVEMSARSRAFELPRSTEDNLDGMLSLILSALTQRPDERPPAPALSSGPGSASAPRIRPRPTR
jgi:TetR/AcrR family transcriptional regulator